MSQSWFPESARCCVPMVCEPVIMSSKCHMLCACGLWASHHFFKVPHVVCLWFVSQSSFLQSAKCCVPVVCEPIIISSECQMLCVCGLWASHHFFRVLNVVCLWFVSKSIFLLSATCCVPVVCEPVSIPSKYHMLCACGLWASQYFF